MVEEQQVSENAIASFMHCKLCLNQIPDDTSPREWVQIEVGMTGQGNFQVWCIRHEIEVAYFDINEFVKKNIAKAIEDYEKGEFYEKN